MGVYSILTQTAQIPTWLNSSVGGLFLFLCGLPTFILKDTGYLTGLSQVASLTTAINTRKSDCYLPHVSVCMFDFLVMKFHKN